jgi:arginyl-tRNA--protein-N-Asp/Glu arginylyltransferase
LQMIDTFHRRMTLEHIAVQTWESLLEEGHDRLGTLVRRSQFAYDDAIGYAQRMPLRYNLKPDYGTFEFSKSQRKLLRINESLSYKFAVAVASDEKQALFERWYIARFGHPESLSIWFKQDTPIRSYDLLVYKHDRLIACSNFDITEHTQYSNVAFYDPDEKHLNLGTWTMLKELELGLRNNKLFHYPGYAYMEVSKFQYKKNFPNTEFFDWYSKSWRRLSDFDAHHREEWELGSKAYYWQIHQQQLEIQL